MVKNRLTDSIFIRNSNENHTESIKNTDSRTKRIDFFKNRIGIEHPYSFQVSTMNTARGE